MQLTRVPPSKQSVSFQREGQKKKEQASSNQAESSVLFGAGNKKNPLAILALSSMALFANPVSATFTMDEPAMSPQREGFYLQSPKETSLVEFLIESRGTVLGTLLVLLIAVGTSELLLKRFMHYKEAFSAINKGQSETPNLQDDANPRDLQYRNVVEVNQFFLRMDELGFFDTENPNHAELMKEIKVISKGLKKYFSAEQIAEMTAFFEKASTEPEGKSGTLTTQLQKSLPQKFDWEPVKKYLEQSMARLDKKINSLS